MGDWPVADKPSEPDLISQVAAGVVAADHAETLARLADRLAIQDAALGHALGEIDKVREFVGCPEHILGNAATKHGEIAEQVEVAVRNAADYLRLKMPGATFEGISRIAATDYRIDGADVQSKFINGARGSLDHVLDHLKKYENFGRDGNSYYHIPRDQHDLISQVLRGDSAGDLSVHSRNVLAAKVQDVERLTGQGFDDVVKPSVSKYADVTRGRIHQTLDRHEQAIRGENRSAIEALQAEAQPSLGDAAAAAGKGAVVGAGLNLTLAFYAKHKQGKNPFRGDYTAEDWRDVGIQTLSGSLQGGVAAGAIYGLTSYADLAAPFAGAVVSSMMAVKSLALRYKAGAIVFDEFVELGMLTCSEAAIVAIASAAGQALIPLPAVGALIGALGGRLLCGAAKHLIEEDSSALAMKLAKQYEQQLSSIGEAAREAMERILSRYEQLEQLTLAAFDPVNNASLRLAASIDLAREHGVAESDILHNEEELDAFMLA